MRDYAVRWLEAKAGRLKPSTATRYADELALYILPKLGDLRLDQLTRRDVEVWASWAERVKPQRGGAYSSVTVRTWWRTLCALLRDASAELGLPDPTYRVRPPERYDEGARHRERRTLTAQELVAFLEAVQQTAPQCYVEVATMAWTGMRAGEVYGLRWKNIDLEARVIHVRESVWRGVHADTKTHTPREVPIPDALVSALRAHRRQQIADQHPGLAEGVVFPSAVGGWRAPRHATRLFIRASERAGLELVVTPQVLRRTYNTLMIRAGIDRLVLRSLMGHTTEEMTARYAGVDLTDKRAAVQLLPIYLGPSLGTPADLAPSEVPPKSHEA